MVRSNHDLKFVEELLERILILEDKTATLKQEHIELRNEINMLKQENSTLKAKSLQWRVYTTKFYFLERLSIVAEIMEDQLSFQKSLIQK